MTDCHCNDPGWEGDVCPADGRQLTEDAPVFPELWGGTYRDRVRRSRTGETGNECVVCGRPTTRKRGMLRAGLFIRMDDSLTAPILWDDPREEDGGCFPVGWECAKRFPPGYIGEMDAHLT